MSWTHPESTERKLRKSDALAIQLPSSSRCTRQNISYIVKREQLPVLKHGVNGNLYLKGDVEKNLW